MSANLSAIFYLVSGILFILALRGLSSPETSRQGNYFGIAGMTIAIVVTFLSIDNLNTGLIYVLIFLIMIGAFFPGIRAVQITISIFFKVSESNSSCFFLKSSEASFA